MHEFDIIAKYFSPLAGKYALGLTDDAAVITPRPGYDMVVTKDALASGTHFFANDTAVDIARKLIRVNVSDLAAMGAKPVAYFLALVLPKNTSESWISDFTSGIQADIEEFGGSLSGGDTVTHDGGVVASLTAIGEVKSGKAITRAGAKTGDGIFVSGTIGDSYIGLQILQKKLTARSKDEEAYFKSRYHIPQPRLELGKNLQGIATSCIDISDGLVADLSHICECSSAGAIIDIDKIPISYGFTKTEELITAGDDYELLFTAPCDKEGEIRKLSEKLSLPVSKIGVVTEGSSVTVMRGDEEVKLENKGYSHI